MPTKLDERTQLIKAIDKLNNEDCQKLSVFLAGFEAGKETKELEKTG